MRQLDLVDRGLGRAARLFLTGLTLSLALVSCANGTSGDQGNTAGKAGTAGATTSEGGSGAPTGGTGGATAGSAGSGAIGGASGAAGSSGTGGDTAGTAGSGTTTTTTTTTSTGPSCPDPATVAGHGSEQESNAIFATATQLAPGDQGFSAVICPAGDIDVFAVPITIQGASLRVEVKGNGVSCPPGAQPYLRVFDADHNLLGQDALGACAIVSPQFQSGVASLAVGTYYVQVENIDFSQVSSYLVEVAVTAPACGDGVLQLAAGEQCDDGNLVPGDGCDAICHVEAVCGDSITHVIAGEQCDDGNMAAGDGCSPTCQFEAVLLTESEPNNQGAPNALDGYDGAVGSILPAGDDDWYSFKVTVPGSTVTISTSDGLGDCPPAADTIIYLYTASNQYITEDDDAAAGACSLISPALDPLASNLAVGTYKIKVEDFGSDEAIQSYVLLVHVSAPGCGDSIQQAGEECEDGNTTAGDGCSPTCLLEGNYAHEIEPNPLATPNSLSGFDGVIASISGASDTDAFSFDVTVPGSSVVIEVSDGLGMCPNFDSVITLYDPADMLIVTDDQGGVSPCSRIDPQLYPEASNLPVGTYKVLVEDFNLGTIPQYVLTVKVAAPGCGDSLFGPGEQCDDGNTTAGDGCSDTCQSEAPWEIEPNDGINTATAVWPGYSGWNGSIQSVGDHDWYKLTISAGQTIVAATHTVNSPATCPFDSVIHLVNAANNQITEDDDAGVDNCSALTVPGLPAGVYFIWVQAIGDGDAAGPYALDLTLQ